MARPLRRRPGRRADGLHREPAVRPPPLARRHRRLARPRRRARARRAARRRRARPPCSPRSTRVEQEMADGSFAFAQSDEDIHTAVERRVTELAGPAGAKLHTARSRNDQVATDLRLWCKRELIEVARLVVALEDVLLGRAPRRPATPTCPATPTSSGPSRCSSPTTCSPTAGRWRRDVDRLAATRRAARRLARSAPAPWPARHCRSTRPRPPRRSASRDVFDNSLDAVSDRDFVAEALFDLALLGAAPRPARRGVGAVDDRRVRLRPPRRRLRHRLVDAAAEEEPRRRRARPRQGGPADRQPHRAARRR